MTGMRILNGRTAGDIPAAATSLGYSGQGRAVVDVFMACPVLLPQVQSLEVGRKLVAATDHQSVTVRVKLRGERAPDAVAESDATEAGFELPETPENLRKEFTIEPKKLGAFQDSLKTPELTARLQRIGEAANEAAMAGDVAAVHAAAEEFTVCI